MQRGAGGCNSSARAETLLEIQIAGKRIISIRRPTDVVDAKTMVRLLESNRSHLARERNARCMYKARTAASRSCGRRSEGCVCSYL